MQKPIRKFLTQITPTALIDFEYPDPSRVLGLSTSHYTGPVDWSVAKTNGIRFAYIKAMDGLNANVKFWRENYEGAKAVGIKVGHYSWLYSSKVASSGGQARAFASFCKTHPSDLPPCVDYEWTASGNPTVNELYGFVVPFEEQYGSVPAIYTSWAYWHEQGSTNSLWSKYPLWQAQYNHGQADTIKPWPHYEFLQWTEKGKGTDYGVPVWGERACELNYYYGTFAEFETQYGEVPDVVDPPPIEIIPPPTGATMNYKGTVKAGLTANIKSMTGSPSGTIATLPAGGYVYGIDSGTDITGFSHYYRPTGQKVEIGYACKVSKTNLVCMIEQEPGTIPPPDPDPIPDTNLSYSIHILDNTTGKTYGADGLMKEIL